MKVAELFCEKNAEVKLCVYLILEILQGIKYAPADLADLGRKDKM